MVKPITQDTAHQHTLQDILHTLQAIQAINLAIGHLMVSPVTILQTIDHPIPATLNHDMAAMLLNDMAHLEITHPTVHPTTPTNDHLMDTNDHHMVLTSDEINCDSIYRLETRMLYRIAFIFM